MEGNRRILGIVGIVVLVIALGAVIYGVVGADRTKQHTFQATSFEVVTEEGLLEGSECPVFEVNAEGSGQEAELGEFTVVRRHCFTPPDRPDFKGSVMHDGTYEITTANGDKIWGTYGGELQPTEFGEDGPIRGTITSPTTIDGGTGRFTDAQGEYTAVADYDLVADEGDFEFEGRISY